MRWRRRIVSALIAATIAATLPAIAVELAIRWLPYPTSLADRPASATWIVDRHHLPLATLVAEDGSLHRWADGNDLGPYLADAVVAVEDERFFQHGAVDWRSMTGSIIADVRAKLTGATARRGASTITMQLARLREPLGRSIVGKLIQMFRASQIEQRESKAAILIDYLNRAPFGGNLVGVSAASWRYFGKPPASLSLSQSALLAGLPQNPNGDRPDRYRSRAESRRDHVLSRMRACGMITDEQLRQAIAEPVDARWLSLPQVNFGQALAHGAMPTLIAAVGKEAGEQAGEQAVTIDLDTQEKTIGVAEPALRAFNCNGSHAAAAVVVLDVQTAECLAAVSIGDRPGLDLTHRRRSTGSVLKPFIYAAAFQAGLSTPQSMLNDAPTAWIGYSPRNFDRTFRGEIDADAALAESRNLPAMMLLAKVGLTDATRLLASLGLEGLASSARPVGLTLAVGGAEASAWEIAQAYATLARGGESREASLHANSPGHGATILARPACLAVLHSLSESDRTQAISPAAALLGAAWKTGTSSGSRDAWCAAVTPRRVVVAWVGNASGSSDVALKGVSIAAPIALDVLASIDPGGEPFEILSREPVPNVRHGDVKQSIAIVEPIDHQQFIVDPSTDLNQQQILCRAGSDARSTAPIWWFLDRTLIGKSTLNQPIAWTPRPGLHTLRAVTESGVSSPVRFTVGEP